MKLDRRTSMSARFRVVVGVGTALAVAAAVSPGFAASNAREAGVQTAKSNLAAAMKLPRFHAPGAPVKMSALSGKNVWILTSTQGVPFVAAIGKAAAQAGGVVGWKMKVNDGKGNVTEWSRILSLAVSQKVDAIITVGASPEVMKSAMAKAKAARIPVVDVATADKTAPLVPGTFSHVSISFYDSGRLQADEAIVRSNGKAHALIMGDNEFPGEVTRVKGMQDEFKKLCPGCKSTVRDNQVAKLATDLSPTTQTLLRKDPSIDYVLPTYDAQALYIIQGIKSAGLAKKVAVISSDAVPSNLDATAKNDVQVADVGEPAGWLGWAAVDEIGRALSKMKPVDENVPLRMFVASNLKGVNTKDENALFGGTYVARYKKLWGMS
jgi:ribose transport system substrate-binding protein